MAFDNLLKPPHLRRFLIALAAGVTAIAIYLSAEHFKVVPGTGALDDAESPPPALGERSLAILPSSAVEPEGLSSFIVLELIRRMVRVPEIEVISARSALGLPDLQQMGEVQTRSLETAWVLEVRAKPEEEGYRLGAVLTAAGEELPAWGLEVLRPAAEIPEFIDRVTAALAENLDFPMPVQAGEMLGAGSSAYRDYQAAWLMLTFSGSNGERTRRLLDRLLESVPGWPMALAARGYSYVLQAAGELEAAQDLLDMALSDLDTAQRLQPELAEIYLYRSLIAHRFGWDWQRAYDYAQEALALAPGDAAVLEAASTAAFTLGRFDEGVEQLRRAIALDPLVLSPRLKLGLMLEFSGAHQSAIDAYRELMVIDPDYPGVHAYLGRTLAIVGRAEPALRHMAFEPSPFWQAYGTVLALQALGRQQEADAELDGLIRDYGGEAAVQIAEVFAHSDRVEQAFEWLDVAIEQRDPGMASLIGNPLFEGLHDDPRWPELLGRLGLPLGENIGQD